MAGIQEILNLRIYSDNLTIIGAINNKTLKKKILGIVKDIHLLASAFVSISFFFIWLGSSTRKRMRQQIPS
ncbi:unnamed protein product, partial [Brassica rapa subsp. trilocularis]